MVKAFPIGISTVVLAIALTTINNINNEVNNNLQLLNLQTQINKITEEEIANNIANIAQHNPTIQATPPVYQHYVSYPTQVTQQEQEQWFFEHIEHIINSIQNIINSNF